MSDEVKKYIVYAEFSTPEFWLPCVCDEVKTSALLEDAFVLINVTTMSDNRFPKFDMNEVHVRKRNVLYITRSIVEPIDNLKEMIQSETDKSINKELDKKRKSIKK